MRHNPPAVRQRAGHDCGASVAKWTLAKLGRPIDGAERFLESCPKNGTPPERLSALFVWAGLGVAQQAGMNIDCLNYITTEIGPVLCPVQLGPSGHWVAVWRVTKHKIRLMDPAQGFRDTTHAAFERRWNDKTAEGTVLVRFGMTVWAY